MAEVVAVGIVAGFFDLPLAAVGAKLVERSPARAQRFFELPGARAGLNPFGFERGFQLLEARFFATEILGLQSELFAG